MCVWGTHRGAAHVRTAIPPFFLQPSSPGEGRPPYSHLHIIALLDRISSILYSQILVSQVAYSCHVPHAMLGGGMSVAQCFPKSLAYLVFIISRQEALTEAGGELVTPGPAPGPA